METISNSIFEEIEPQLVLASQGKRFLNYIIDMVVFYAFTVFLILILGMLRMYAAIILLTSDEPIPKILSSIIFTIIYAMLLGSMEAIFKGKTLGKLITGTRAVNEDGSPTTTATAFKRGLSRAVPVSAFSALGNPSYPWQDKWTNTYVIDEKQSQRSTMEQY
jgi:uncharacterized RDD family membrane protein YckC